MTHPLRRRRPGLGPALVLVVALAAAACSSGGDEAEGPTSTEGTTTTTLPPRFPLTGLVAGPADAEALGRPALTVKIENAAVARPQAGLDQADVVYEEVVEGGQTRFLAVFHSAGSDVGPVRSVRPTDPDVVGPLGGLFAYSGGTAPFVAKLRQTPGLVDVGASASPDAYRRRSDRSSPHNLYSSTDALYTAGPGDLAPPGALWAFTADDAPFAPAGAAELRGLDIRLGATTTATYTWDEARGGWLRTTDGRAHLVESGAQLAPANVIVQFVPYRDSGGRDAAGSVVPEATVVGQGEALVLSGGRYVRGRWAKASGSEATVFTDAAGQPIALRPGRTWVELVDVGAPFTLDEPPPPPTTAAP